MRKPGTYPAPSYRDPQDKRMTQIIAAAARSQPKSVNILGVPFDGAVLGRKGAAGGPDAIRQAMSSFSNYNLELRVGLEDARVFDLGDLVLDSDDVVETHSRVKAEVSEVLRNDSLLAILGGDNSITLPALAACSDKFGKLGLIVIDSHLDLRGRINGKPTSGSSYGLAVEGQVVDPKNLVEVGIHGFLNSKTYFEKAKELGIRLFTADDVRQRGPRAVAHEAYRLLSRGVEAVYLSMDLDAVDLSLVSGVSAPSAGGIGALDLFTLAHEISREPRVKCADLVELAPTLDPTGRSQRVAATALMYLIAGYRSRKERMGRSAR